MNPVEELLRQFGPIYNVKKREHTDYSHAVRDGTLDPVFEILALDTIPYKTIPTLAKRSGVKEPTLCTWRRNLKRDPTWRPDPHRKGVHTALTQEEEAIVAARLRESFVTPGEYCPPAMIDQLASAQVATRTKEAARPFRHSYSWRQGFLSRHHLSIRKFHYKRRSDPNDEIVARYCEEFSIAKQQFRFEDIINVDETSWRIVNSRMVTVSETGQEDVRVKFQQDEKACITVIAGIARDGSKLPLWVIASGCTDRSHDKFMRDFRLNQAVRFGKLVITHSERGWTNTEVAKAYLSWLHTRNNGSHKYLIWDVFAAHRSEEVRKYATEKRIHLAFVPSGQTDDWQPLDYRIFGAIKERAKERFDGAAVAAMLKGEKFDPTLNDALATLLDIWKGVPQDEVLGAWSILE